MARAGEGRELLSSVSHASDSHACTLILWLVKRGNQMMEKVESCCRGETRSSLTFFPIQIAALFIFLQKIKLKIMKNAFDSMNLLPVTSKNETQSTFLYFYIRQKKSIVVASFCTRKVYQNGYCQLWMWSQKTGLCLKIHFTLSLA